MAITIGKSKDRKYYTVFACDCDIPSFYFLIPEMDGPFPGEGHGDMLCGPYEDESRAVADCAGAQHAAISATKEMRKH